MRSLKGIWIPYEIKTTRLKNLYKGPQLVKVMGLSIVSVGFKRNILLSINAITKPLAKHREQNKVLSQ